MKWGTRSDPARLTKFQYGVQPSCLCQVVQGDGKRMGRRGRKGDGVGGLGDDDDDDEEEEEAMEGGGGSRLCVSD